MKHGGQWIEIPEGTKDLLYLSDSVLQIKKCGRVTCEKLHKVGIMTVGEYIQNYIYSRKKIIEILPKPTAERIYNNCRNCIKSQCPDARDYREDTNPYFARYKNRWKKEIATTLFMQPFVEITDMIEYMMEECRRVMNGTKHQEDWMFYHDALSLMTLKETRRWMQEKDYLQRWLLPVNDLFSDDTELKSYLGRPPGNSPKLMPLDSNLNEDIHKAVDFHVRMSAKLTNNDPRKLSLSTPKKGTDAYLKVVDPVDGVAPTSS